MPSNAEAFVKSGHEDTLIGDAVQPTMPSLVELEAALERSAAQIAAGDSVPLEPALRRLSELADRLRREGAASGPTPTPEA